MWNCLVNGRLPASCCNSHPSLPCPRCQWSIGPMSHICVHVTIARIRLIKERHACCYYEHPITSHIQDAKRWTPRCVTLVRGRLGAVTVTLAAPGQVRVGLSVGRRGFTSTTAYPWFTDVLCNWSQCFGDGGYNLPFPLLFCMRVTQVWAQSCALDVHLFARYKRTLSYSTVDFWTNVCNWYNHIKVDKAM